MIDTFNMTNNILSSFIQEERESASLCQELKHQRMHQGTWSWKVFVRQKDEKIPVKRLSTLMCLVHTLWEQQALSQWPCPKILCSFLHSLFSFNINSRFDKQKLGFYLKKFIIMKRRTSSRKNNIHTQQRNLTECWSFLVEFEFCVYLFISFCNFKILKNTCKDSLSRSILWQAQQWPNQAASIRVCLRSYTSMHILQIVLSL